MAAFSQANGSVLWEETPKPGFYREVQVQHQRVVAIGSSGRDSLVRVFHAPDGNIVWQHITTPAPGFGDVLTAVALSEDVVYTSATSGQDFVFSEFVVRAYDLSRGNILFEDRSHRSPSTAGGASDIAVGSTQVYAVGRASGGGPSDFLIRAYDRKAIEPGGDVNRDGKVDCADLAIVRALFGKKTGEPGFDARADVVADSIIDVRDLAFVSQRLPAGTRCQ
jgi:hypothetical protein